MRTRISLERSKTRKAILVTLLALALSMVGCGDGAEPPPDAGGTEPAADETAGDSGDEAAGDADGAPKDVPGVDVENKIVTVGGWRIASGDFAAQNEAAQAVEAVFLMWNDRGGINGWTLEYESPDTAGDPTRALEVTRRLVEGDEAFVLLWGQGSSANRPVIPYIAERPDVPYHPGMSGDPFVNDFYPNIFPTIPAYSHMSRLLAQYAMDELGAERLALVYQDDALGQDAHNGMKEFVAGHGGELVADLGYASADTDFTPLARALVDADPDAVIQWGGPAPLVQAKAATMGEGLDVPWLGPYFSADDAVMTLDPEVMDGTYFNYYMVPPFEEENPHVQEYKEAMAEYFPDNTAGGLALNGWASGLVFAEAFEMITRDGQVPTREAYMEALNTFDGREIGVIPSVTYTDEVHQGPSSSFIVQWLDGEWSILGGPFDHPTEP